MCAGIWRYSSEASKDRATGGGNFDLRNVVQHDNQDAGKLCIQFESKEHLIQRLERVSEQTASRSECTKRIVIQTVSQMSNAGNRGRYAIISHVDGTRETKENVDAFSFFDGPY